MDANCERGAFVDLNELMAILVAVLRADGHLCNVLTDVGRGNWQSIEAAIGAILAPRTRPGHLDEMARNLLELICDGPGISGPIMQAVFFGTINREVSQHQATRLRSKIRRLRRKVAAIHSALQEQKQLRTNAASDLSVQPQAPEPAAVPNSSGEASTPPASQQAHEDMPIVHASTVEFGTDAIYVDAALIADGLGLDPASVPAGMRIGEIKVACERGIDADDGLYRLTFFRPGHRVRLVVGPDGQVRQRSSIAFGKLTGGAQQLSA
jgi:Family of unknown function (DUF6522)